MQNQMKYKKLNASSHQMLQLSILILSKWLKCTEKLSQKKKLRLLKKMRLHPKEVYNFSELHKKAFLSGDLYFFAYNCIAQIVLLLFVVICAFELKNYQVSAFVFCHLIMFVTKSKSFQTNKNFKNASSAQEDCARRESSCSGFTESGCSTS